MYSNTPWRHTTAIERTHAASPRTGRSSLVFLLAGLLASLVFAPPSASAADAAEGQIAGRVQDLATGDYLNNARVSVKGTANFTFTDESGSFVLSNVPAGTVTLRVFFTGLDEIEVPVTVAAGQTARQNVQLTNKVRYGEASDVVEMDEFVVQSTRETNASAIAVNEQRVASNITSVVSTDEFGTMVDKNPGEFLKWLPGVDVEYFANNIVGVSVRGLGSANTELNFDGMPVASANAESVGRSFEVQYASAADVARVEIRKLPLPQDSSNALGGSINLVRRSAFEYSKRKISYQALFQADGEKFTFKDIDGPKDKLRTRWRPNWEFKWTEPVNENLGFAFTVGQNNTIANTHWSLPGWNFGSSANNTAAEAAMDAGQPIPNVPSIYNPGMRNPLNHNAPLMQGKDYATGRVDWRPTPELKLSYSLSWTRGWKEVADDIRYRWDAAATGSGNVTRYNDEFTSLGRIGGGGIYHDNPLWRDIDTPTTSHVVDLFWEKDDWEVGAKGVLSQSRYTYHDTDRGFFNSTSVSNVTGLVNIPHTGVGRNSANPVSLTVDYLDTDYWGPKTINAYTTADGTASSDINDYTVPVDWWSNDVARIGGARSRPGTGKEIVAAAKIFVKRHFNTENPMSVQVGLDYTERFKNRQYDYLAWRFVGADGVPESADDSAALIAADNLQRRPDANYGYPGAERISMTKLYDLYEQHPDWFVFDEARSAQRTLTNNAAYELWETTTAPYVQFDVRLMNNRLRLTGGVRYEDNRAEARGLRIDNNNAYMKYSDGSVVHVNDVDADGNLLVQNLGTSTNVNYVLVNGPSMLPAERLGAPVFTPAIQASGNAARAAGQTTDTNTNLGRGTLAHTAAVYTPKGSYAEGGNDNFFPSLHGTYNFTDNLVLQVGYARTQAKNRFDRSVIPQNEITENTLNTSNALGRITLRNKDLKPWLGDNYEARLSYYNSTGGVIGVGVFHKRISDYQLDITSDPMTAEEAAALAAQFPEFGTGQDYIGYELRTWQNVGNATIDGIELEARQSLDPFLPDWARGFQVRGTMAFTNLKGQPPGGDFSNLRDNRYTLNVGYRHRKFSINVGYIMNGEQHNGLRSSNGFSGERITVPQHLVDFNIDYSITSRVRLFLAGNNITNEGRARNESYAEVPDWGELGSSNTFGVTYTAGISGSF